MHNHQHSKSLKTRSDSDTRIVGDGPPCLKSRLALPTKNFNINWQGDSVFKKGSTVPTKFRVCDANGNSVGTLGVVSSFVLVSINGGTVAPVDEDMYSTTPDTEFRWGGDQWIFNFSTKNNPMLVINTTYGFQIRLSDGTFIAYQFGLK